MARGASIVSRTAELTLESSAILAIDGDQNSGWATPHGDTYQSVVISMPAPATIAEIGIRSPKNDQLRVNNVSVEASSDGRSFTTLAEPALQSANDTQTFPVKETEAQYLRVTITGATGGIATISSLQAHGSFSSPPRPGPIAGCWSINGVPTRFVEQNGAVRGRSGSGSAPLRFDGGVEGSLYRFVWVRGPDRGYGAITVAPAGQALSGIRWFVRPVPKNFGGSWFGEKGDCSPAAPLQSVVSHFTGRGEPYPLFGLHFDEQDRLVAGTSEDALKVIAEVVATAGTRKVELLARELRDASRDVNSRRARARLESLRTTLATRRVDLTNVVFTPSDTAADPTVVRTDLARAMNSVVQVSLK